MMNSAGGDARNQFRSRDRCIEVAMVLDRDNVCRRSYIPRQKREGEEGVVGDDRGCSEAAT